MVAVCIIASLHSLHTSSQGFSHDLNRIDETQLRIAWAPSLESNLIEIVELMVLSLDLISLKICSTAATSGQYGGRYFISQSICITTFFVSFDVCVGALSTIIIGVFNRARILFSKAFSINLR